MFSGGSKGNIGKKKVNLCNLSHFDILQNELVNISATPIYTSCKYAHILRKLIEIWYKYETISKHQK